MSNQELYDKVIEAYRSGDENLFNAAARNWIEGAENAQFNDPELNDLFDKAKRCCNAWRNKAINGRVSKIRMINCVRAIAEKGLANPYNPNEKIEEVKQEEDKPEEINKIHVLGVIPEEQPKNFVDKTTIGGWTIEEEKPEEPKETKRIFNRRKKR